VIPEQKHLAHLFQPDPHLTGRPTKAATDVLGFLGGEAKGTAADFAKQGLHDIR
jgi:hypothetical protein